jgi:ABC-type multidrug transport system fused ATPase/permease subunit
VNSLSTAVGGAIVISSRGKRVFEILDSDELVSEKTNAHEFKHMKGEIKFENVVFGYAQDNGTNRAVLDDINFHVKPGQVVALVGQTGSGKTSLISMVARFYDHGKVKYLLTGMT